MNKVLFRVFFGSAITVLGLGYSVYTCTCSSSLSFKNMYIHIYLMSILRADSITLDSQVTLYMYIHVLMRD